MNKILPSVVHNEVSEDNICRVLQCKIMYDDVKRQEPEPWDNLLIH